jgi:hypothetical protein
MSDASQVPNIHGPSTPQESTKNAPVDPEKFKRLLKVEESDEAQKRNKRNLKKQEEGDDDETQAAGEVPRAGLFESLLRPQESKDSIFSVTEPLNLPTQTKPPIETSSQAPVSEPSTFQAQNLQSQVNAVSSDASSEFFFVPTQPTENIAPIEEAPIPAPEEEAPTPPVYSEEPTAPPAVTPPTTPSISTPSLPEEETPTPSDETQQPATPTPTSVEKKEPKKEISKKPLIEKPVISPPLKPLAKPLKPSLPVPPTEKASTQPKKPAPTLTPPPTKSPTKPPKVLSLNEIDQLKPFVIEEPSPKPAKEAPLTDQNLGKKKPASSIEPSTKKPLLEKEKLPESKEEKTPTPLETKSVAKPTEEEKTTPSLEEKPIAKEAETPSTPTLATPIVPPQIKEPEEKPFAETADFSLTKEQPLVQGKEESTTFVAAKPVSKPSSTPSIAPSISPIPTGEATLSDKGKDQQGQKQKEKETVTPIEAPLITPYIEAITPAPPAELPVYSRLSPEVFEIFQRMVGMMTIQKESGISTTTITISKPGSLFDSGKLVLEHYDTAPHAFNVEFQGNEAQVNLFNENITDLVAAIQQAKLTYNVNVRRASLSTPHRIVERKEDVNKETNQ